MTTDNTYTIRVMVPLLEHMIATSITLPLEMLEAATTYCRVANKQYTIHIHFCGETDTEVKTTGGLTLKPDTLYSEQLLADWVIIPALWRNPMPLVRKNKVLTNWIKHQYQNNAIFSVGGTGVSFLAEAGLLNGQPAATHWYYLERLQKKYPAIDFKPHHLVTRSGRIYCAGSVNSVADLTVHLIKITMGKAIALQVEQQFSHEIRKSFEETCFSDDQVTTHQDEVIVMLQEWLQRHYQDNLSLDDMCQHSGLHSRTLTRRFKQATGMSPISYLKDLRLRQGKELLKTTNLGIVEIALQVGFNSPDYFTRSFHKHFQIKPTDFRRSVREKLFQLH